MTNWKRSLSERFSGPKECANMFQNVDCLSLNFNPPRDSFGEGNCSVLDFYKNHKFVNIPLKYCLNKTYLDYVHLNFMRKAQSIVHNEEKPVVLLNNYKSFLNERNDCKRVAHTICYDIRGLLVQIHKARNDGLEPTITDVETENLEFSNIIACIVHLVKSTGLVPCDVYPTSSSGAMNTMNLLVSYPECLPQHFHFDYDPKSFDVKDGVYRGSSLFINFKRSTVTLDIGVREGCPSIRRSISIPAMSVFVFRGDFRHAGSANSTNKEVWKYFMYMDPYDFVPGGFRAASMDNLYYEDAEDRSFIADVQRV